MLKIIILVSIVLFFCVLCFLIYMLRELTIEENLANISQNNDSETVQSVIEKFDSKLIKEEDNIIYIEFAKDLFDESGNSNEEYFNKLIDKMKIFYSKSNFTLIDNKKHIEIVAEFIEGDNYSIKINGEEGYFEKIKGENYAKATNVTIGYKSIIFTINSYLKALQVTGMNPRFIKSGLDEGIELDNGYVSYNDDTIQIKTSLIKTIRNIIFTNKYTEEEIIKGVTTKTPLKEIEKLYPDYNFGGIREDYLGYITEYFYYFFYDDEVSVYGLTYREDDKFEEILIQYLEDKDLDKFVNSIESILRYYDYLEYDPEIKKAHIMCSSRGYEIDIEENDPKGIILYNNYYFTDTTRELIRQGKISVNEDVNLVDKIEKDRRKNR